jgi:hypothetical protein
MRLPLLVATALVLLVPVSLPAQDPDARGLIDIVGTADESDARLVAAELRRLPRYLFDLLRAKGTRVKVCRGSVVERDPDLADDKPRGWDEGKTWKTVPGLSSGGCASSALVCRFSKNEVVIATIGHGTAKGPRVPVSGEGHGSWNLVCHEVGHAVDGDSGKASREARFLAARNADYWALDPYEQQKGWAGPEETFAESLARFCADPAAMKATWPRLHAYWSSDPLAPKPTTGLAGKLGAP